VIAALAAGQLGVVARRQLIAAGLTESMILRRTRSGRLVQLHRGVYAVGHRHLRREAWWLAAVLAVPGSVLSHRDAAGLHGIRSANHTMTDVTTTSRATDHRGIRVHRTRVLDAADVTKLDGIPTTTLARTLVDLAGIVPRDHLFKALREAESRRTLDVRAIEDALHRTRSRRGKGHQALREALAEYRQLGATTTRSTLEDAFLSLLRRHGLPTPQTNIVIEGMEVDAAWRERRLVVELDGWGSHGTRHAFEHDRERDAALAAAGWRTVRFTHRQVMQRPDHVVEVLRRLGL
jgi:very-short-patch-repair endonuclease